MSWDKAEFRIKIGCNSTLLNWYLIGLPSSTLEVSALVELHEVETLAVPVLTPLVLGSVSLRKSGPALIFSNSTRLKNKSLVDR